MNKTRSMAAILLCVLLLPCAVSAQGATEDFKSVPAGVFDIEYDQGKVVRLKIKGEADISKALSPVKANKQARDKALRDAKSQFSKWLNEDVTVVETSEEVVILVEINGEGAGRAIDKTSTQYQSVSQGLLRGLTVLFEDADGQAYTVVLGWSHALASAAEDVSGQVEDPRDRATVANPGSDPGKGVEKVKRSSRNPDKF